MTEHDDEQQFIDAALTSVALIESALAHYETAPDEDSPDEDVDTLLKPWNDDTTPLLQMLSTICVRLIFELDDDDPHNVITYLRSDLLEYVAEQT